MARAALVAGIGILALVLGAFFAYTPTPVLDVLISDVPYHYVKRYQTVAEQSAAIWAHGRIEIPGLQYVWYRIPINVRGSGFRVEGRFDELTGGDISIYVFDEDSYYDWRNQGTKNAILALEKVGAQRFTINFDKSGDYYWVFDNSELFDIPDRVIRISASQIWTGTVTRTTTIHTHTPTSTTRTLMKLPIERQIGGIIILIVGFALIVIGVLRSIKWKKID